MKDEKDKTLEDNKFSRLKLCIPRAETLILLLGLVITIGSKSIVLHRQNPTNIFSRLLPLILPDIIFFGIFALIITCLYMVKPTRFFARLALLAASLVLLWSVLNAAWIIKAGVQLQLEVLLILIRDFSELWPFVKTHLILNFTYAAALGISLFVGVAYFIWMSIYPAKVITFRKHHIYKAVGITLIIIMFFLARLRFSKAEQLTVTDAALNFSSHWYVIASQIVNHNSMPQNRDSMRQIPRVGQRIIGLPGDIKSLPNIIIIFLESIPYIQTSLGSSDVNLTPNLLQISQQGVNFCHTHAVVSHTTKAIWASLTSTNPVINSDYVEALPTNPKYESLPSILKSVGYRSAFFKMAKGSFECAPSLCNNLGFDWAWFRENLNDPSKYLGYLAGDDCQLIKPAFDWIAKSDAPFLLVILTTVTHDPYEVPEEFAVAQETPYDNYIQAVRYTDYFLGHICDNLKRLGLEKNTLLCLIGDHGISFRADAGHHGRWEPYEESFRVPWVMRWPEKIKSNTCIQWPCSQLDVTPTILNLIGFDIGRAEFEGKDAFIPSQPNRRLYFASWYRNSPMGYRQGCYKVVYWPYVNKLSEYDLLKDPNEQSPISLARDNFPDVKRDIVEWQRQSEIFVEPRLCSEELLYLHWRTVRNGNYAMCYYVP